VFDSTPLVVGERAFVGTMAGELVAVDLTKSRVVSRFRLGGFVVADPVLCGGHVLAVSTRGRICSVRP
jgi:hypothetical protein